jgi:hypothetical protein
MLEESKSSGFSLKNGFWQESIDAFARPNVDWSWSGGVRSQQHFQDSTP